MVIDIIDYKEEQYAELTDSQILEIRDAQRKKNERIGKMYDEMRALRQKAVNNGMRYSRAFELEYVQLQEDCDADIWRIKEDLMFYLLYASRLEDVQGSEYPLDYSLPVEERCNAVKGYYLDMYSDAQERFQAFQKDKIARTYLCDTYASLLDYFWLQANA